MFYVNGVSYGVAAENIPPNVYAVVDLYGKVVQVTATSGTSNCEYLFFTMELNLKNSRICWKFYLKKEHSKSLCVIICLLVL